MNIADILSRHATSFGDRLAIVERRRRITFAELNRAAMSAAVQLSDAGLAAGTPALVVCPMSIDLYVTMIGLFRLGAVAVFLDPSAGGATLAGGIARVRPEAFIGIPRAHLLRLTSTAVRAIPIRIAMGGWVPGARTLAGRATSSAPPVASCCNGEPAIITFTSGTTGAARAVARSHGFLRAQHSAIADSLRLTPGEVDLTTLPIFLLANLASGLTSIIPDADLRAPGRIDPLPVLDQIRSERPSRTVASPALLEQLASGAARTGEPLGTLRKVFTGGAPVFPRTLDALAAIAPNASITAVYGSTEAEPIACIERQEICSADRVAMQRGAGVLVGRPAPSIRVRILPDRWGTPIPPVAPSEFDRDTLPLRRAGEIVVSGAHVVPGYLDGEGNEGTKILVGGEVWHRTGDAGYVDGEGRLWLLGRCSARVTDDDGVQYPLAVECAASGVSGVRRSAFLQHRGRRVLVVETDPTDAFPRRSLVDQLAWAHLEELIPIHRIPVDRRHNAKIDLAALRDTLA